MKRFLALLLAAILCLSFAACGGGNDADVVDGNDGSETVVDEVPNAADLVSDAFIDPVKDWAQYDALIDEIKACTDYAKRTELMHQAEDILMSNYCVIPFYFYNDIYLQKDYVEGVFANLFGTKFFMYASLGNGSDTLRLNLASEPAYLDPALNSSVDGACLAANSFSGLYTIEI